MNDDFELYGFCFIQDEKGFLITGTKPDEYYIYGSFAVLLANCDCEKVVMRIKSVLDTYSKNYNFDEFSYNMQASIQSSLPFGIIYYPKTQPFNYIVQLITIDIMSRLYKDNFQIKNINDYIPIIFSNTEIQDLTRNILLRNTEDLNLIMEKNGENILDLQLIDMHTNTYYPKDITSYLLLDLKMYIEYSTIIAKKCECCGRIFSAKRKSDKYCRFPNPKTFLTCDKIMHRSPNDKFAKARNRARDKQHKAIKYFENTRDCDHSYVIKLYDDWSDKCKEQFKIFKKNNDFDGFEKWINDTKFTVSNLEEKCKNHKKP